jgi:hypothetical protein
VGAEGAGHRVRMIELGGDCGDAPPTRLGHHVLDSGREYLDDEQRNCCRAADMMPTC